MELADFRRPADLKLSYRPYLPFFKLSCPVIALADAHETQARMICGKTRRIPLIQASCRAHNRERAIVRQVVLVTQLGHRRVLTSKTP
jgi:hypothetical protein